MLTPIRTRHARGGARPLTAALLGLAAAFLIACGSSGSGLIPAASAGPLQSDFEAVSQAAQKGNGNCLATESSVGKTEQDFLALPASIDAGLRKRLHEGIANLRKVALAMCAQPSPTATTTSTQQTTTTPTTTTSTQTTPATTTPTTTTPATPAEPNNGGGTAAPREGQAEEGSGKDKGKGKEGKGDAGSEENGAGGASPEGGK